MPARGVIVPSNRRVRVKICGITRVEDARAAANAGVDAIGLVFYPKSPRYVEPQRAQSIVAALPPFVTVVGLFVNADHAQVRSIMQQVPLDILQFHGDEPPDYCASFGLRYIKAVRMHDEIDLETECRRYAHACGLLVDAYVPGIVGGTGTTFDWQRLPRDLGCHVILAGGLEPANVAAAVRATQPWAVDVSGGVEEEDGQGGRRAGIKSPAAIAAFMRGVECVGEN